MARRRVNTKFLAIAGTSVTVALAGLAGLYKLRHGSRPEPFIAAGDGFAKQGDFRDAVGQYARAVQLRPADADLHLKLGKALFASKSFDPSYVGQAVGELTRAEELNPNSKEAWGALLSVSDFIVSQVEQAPNLYREQSTLPTQISIARDAAENLHHLDPENIDALVAGYSLNIRAWLLRLSIPRTAEEKAKPIDQQLNDDQMIDQTIIKLTQLMAKNPSNESIPYWIARAKLNQALLAMNAGNTDNASLFAEATSEFDNSIAASPKSVGLYLRKAEIIQRAQQLDPSAASAAEYRQQVRSALDSAQKIADPKNPDQYQMAKHGWARLMASTDPGRAEQVYRDLIKQFPETPAYRIELADLVRRDYSRSDEALALLDEIPSAPPADLTSYDLQAGWSVWVSRAKLMRARIDVDKLRHTATGKQRDDIAADTEASLTAADRLNTSLDYLRVKGGYQMAMNRVRDAIQTYTAAVDQMSRSGGAVDFALLRDESDAYIRGGQTGHAIEVLEHAMTDPRIANNIEIHQTLATLHIANKDYSKAKPYVDWLAMRLPDDPSVIQLQIQVLGAHPDLAQAKPFFDRLPEHTENEQRAKLNVAISLNDAPDFGRLLTSIHQSNPGDVTSTIQLAEYLGNQGKSDTALAVVNDSLKVHPDDPNLRIEKDKLGGATASKQKDDTLEAIAGMPDAFQREMSYAGWYEANGQPDEQLKHLLAASQIRPADIVCQQTLFQIYLASQKFTEAEAMLPHLTDIDADNAHGLILRAKLALARHDVPTAVAVGRQLVHDMPEFSKSYEMLGEALHAAGQTEAACDQFISALDKNALEIDATRNLIFCNVELNRMTEAKRYIQEAINRFPDDPAYKEIRVNFEIQYGDPELVVPDLRAVVQAHPNMPKAFALLADAQLASARKRANSADAEGARQYLLDSLTTMQTAMGKFPDNLGFASALANLQRQAGDNAGAEKTLKDLAARPRWQNRAEPQIALGDCYMRMNKPAEAETCLRAALALAPHHIQALELLSEILVSRGQYDQTLMLLKPDIKEPAILQRYVGLLLQTQKGPEAEDLLAQRLKDDPTNGQVRILLVQVYQAEHKKDEAMKMCNELIAADQQNYTAYFYRGALAGSGADANLEQAEGDLKTFVEAVPQDVRGHLMLASVYDLRHNQDEAIRQLQQAVRVGPLDRNARALLLQDYIRAVPSQEEEAQRLLAETLALPEFAHDPVFLMQAAHLAAKRNDTDKAVDLAQQAITNSPDKTAMVNDYLTILLQAKKFDLLLKESQSYSTDPATSWVVYDYRGEAKAFTGDIPGATAEFQTALDRAGSVNGVGAAQSVCDSIINAMGVEKALQMVQPRATNSASWDMVLASIYVRKNDIPSAIVATENAAKSMESFRPEDRKVLLTRLGTLYLHATPPQPDKAQEAYQKILAKDPDDLEALNNMACLLTDMVNPPRPAEALQYSQRAYDLVTKEGHYLPTVFDTHGWALIQAGSREQIDAGISIIYDGTSKFDFPDAHYHLAMAFLKEKRAVDADTELNHALDMITNPEKNHSSKQFDPDLKAKIDAALKIADQMKQASPPAQ